MRIAITGADGFVGKHATRVFRERGHEVIELVGGDAPNGGTRIDLRSPTSVRAALAEACASHVLHLAGASSVARSHENPTDAFEVNTVGTVNLLDAIHRAAPRARVVVVSSGEVYGNLDHAAREGDATNPTSPYAASKVAAELAARQFVTAYQMQVVIARPFNHIGAGQAAHFVIPSFASQLAEIARAGGSGELRVGNLEVVRDFSHVLDVVDAYGLLLERAEAGNIYNVASEVPRSIRSLLDELIAVSCVNARVTVDPARLRPSEIPSLVGNASRLMALGWAPVRSIDEALRAVFSDVSAAKS